MGFVVHKVALEEVIFRLLWFSHFSINPPLFRVPFHSHHIG